MATKKKSKPRAQQRNPDLEQIVRGLRILVRQSVPAFKESVNPWGIATFESNGPICYHMTAENHVTFGFLRATSLDDPEGLLEGTGKNLRHVKLRALDDLKRPGLKQLIAAAARLNRDDPGFNPMARKKK
jgi:hypothetical protein